MNPSKVILTLLLASPLISLAGGNETDNAQSGGSIYKTVAPDGSVVFSDKPLPGEPTEKIELAPTNVQPIALPRTLPTRKLSPRDQGGDDYAGPVRFAIVSPMDGATIPPGQRSIVLEVAMDPVPSGDYQFFAVVDGRPWAGASSGTSLDISALERGTHSVQAVLVDAAGNELARSQIITLYVKRPGGVLPDNPAAQASQAPKAPVAPGLPRAKPPSAD
ncbi:DUF4124 domain-containing protein [Microbulbifer thermotolerans]|uniref:DUF4124 domain-containing protein n=1 Tax=Microbulbifer thermotolerans TaxID=252514 RepID=UPI0022499448|nr:DUF4124 domain-containing protein [Microbulbifer thermotolerans]MCX2832275.1 DUF4124 domain-containing protein [Microbulbifer thermotolerans]